MFDFLKQKIRGFFKKEEQLLEEKVSETPQPESTGKNESSPPEPAVTEPAQLPQKEPTAEIEQKIEALEERKEEIEAEIEHIEKKEEAKIEKLVLEEAKTEEEIEKLTEQKETATPSREALKPSQEIPLIQKPEPTTPTPALHIPEHPMQTKKYDIQREEKELKPRLSLFTKVKKAVLRKATIQEKDVDGLLSDFNLALLESDVTASVADALCEDIRKKLVGFEISGKDDVRKIIEQSIKEALKQILKQEETDLITRIRTKKPFIILFVGPNGHGKSSTIGKLAAYLKSNNTSSVIAAADTFRAAAIEQLEAIAAKAGVRVIKHKYGADPAAVCFDAVKHAQANGIDVVLIDTAGRSELNVNLMEQMKKIVRVVKPDSRIYIGEALAGNAAVEEARKFDEAIGIDGIIITKIDCDVKGGSLLSISKTLGKPVLFVTSGQNITDIQKFDADWFVNKLMG